VTTVTMNELRKCDGCVKELPKIIHGLLQLYYEFANYDIVGSDAVKPRLNYGNNGMQWLCNGLRRKKIWF